MAPCGRVLILEQVIPPGNGPFPGKLLDLNMLVMTEGGRERTPRRVRPAAGERGPEPAPDPPHRLSGEGGGGGGAVVQALSRASINANRPINQRKQSKSKDPS
jgi:hypothetical protein